jgi:hypothetical protein
MSAPSPEAAAALESLRQLGFRITSDTGAHRLIRQDGSQAALYSLKGGFGTNSGNLGNISDISADQAAINGLVLAQAILADEKARLAMPRWMPPSLESRPYG